MMQTIFYTFLDLSATVMELGMLYACNIIFCKKKDKIALRLLPYIAAVILIYIMTWLIPLGTAKIVTNAVVFVVLQRLILKEKWYKLIMAYALFFMLMLLNDFSCLIAADVIFGHTSIMVGDIVMNIWQYYALKIIMIVIIIYLLYKVFGKLVYEIQPKDTIIFSIYCIITYCVIYYSTGHGYFTGDVDWFNSMVGISGLLVGCLFLLLFLYQKNSAYLKHEKETARQQRREMELKHAYYEEKFKDEERVREIYHDLKNHLLILQEQQKDSKKPQQMIDSLQSQISDFENYHHTGNEFLDIIIRDKAKKAREQKIDFSAAIHFEDGGFIAPLDVSTIFGNAIDNALEASAKLPQEQRVVTVKANRFRDMLSIVCKNNMLPITGYGTETTKDDIFLHRFGLKNIRQAVENYAGQLSIHQEQGTFTLKIIIPIP